MHPLLLFIAAANASFLRVNATDDPAMVEVDGQLRGPTPLLLELPPGRHELAVRVSRFGPVVARLPVELPAEGGVRVEASLATGELHQRPGTPADAQLPPEPPLPTGTVRVSASEPGAWLYLDGRDLGVQLPASIEVPTGHHRLAARTACARGEAELEVVEGSSVELQLPLQPGTGTLALFTRPQGVEVRLDGVYRGTTPLLIEGVSCGEHVLTLSRDGYYTDELNLRVPAFDHTPVHDTLEPVAYGGLHVRLSPPEAVLLLDGEEVGQGELELEQVLAGLHSLEARADGYSPQSLVVDLPAGQVLAVELRLEPEGQGTGSVSVSPEPPPTPAEPPAPQASAPPEPEPEAAPSPEPLTEPAEQERASAGRYVLDATVTMLGAGLGAHAVYAYTQAQDAYDRYWNEPDDAEATHIYNQEVMPWLRQSIVEGMGSLALLGAGGVLWATTGAELGPLPGGTGLVLRGRW